jgi:hypothetical protein
MPSFEAEPDAVFSQHKWAKIAQSIPLDPLPEQMKQQICDAVFDHVLMSNKQREASARRALKNLVELTRQFRCRLSELQPELRRESIIDQVEGLIEQAYAVQRTANQELEMQPKSKGGRPRELDRDTLALKLLDIFVQFSGKPVGLSRNPDPEHLDRLKPDGTSYRFLFTIFELSGLPTRGLEHVIARVAQHAKNHP